MAKNLKSGEILLLENVRFHKGESENNIDFAKDLSDFVIFLLMMLFLVHIGLTQVYMQLQIFYPRFLEYYLMRKLVL